MTVYHFVIGELAHPDTVPHKIGGEQETGEKEPKEFSTKNNLHIGRGRSIEAIFHFRVLWVKVLTMGLKSIMDDRETRADGITIHLVFISFSSPYYFFYLHIPNNH